MDPATLAARVPVWTALSDLFLDTETRWSIPRVALVLARSPYDEETLARIWRREAIPQFGGNLLAVAGEWAMLDIDEAALARRAESTAPLQGVATRFLLGAPLEAEWNAIVSLTRALRLLPDGERERRSQVWSAFAHVYIEPDLGSVMLLDRHVETLRACGMTGAQLRESFDESFRPAYRALVCGAEAPHAMNVDALIARCLR